mmetsp:Transcript_29153/g.38343  ORF Transcript_29153/g.38343 Transcript_29153/m.38343 type:complete len:285 (+) Transcript_29153:101-955(+)|eukprot:CAMPEP_0117753214 /NCGR_PEP_ID=MMETSP0947-20121206/12085_1 /TAXON_ID=44440 /ORGANISM="Chattonella subsalsa, Strain CCMP2191" /LENGTH=284 /DNA_ID=CAMNT_0005572039 /DNA_START=85 /DNA_END=939 /DNA_ORIENTATION=-
MISIAVISKLFSFMVGFSTILATHETICDPIPAFMWSGSHHLVESNAYDTRTLSMFDFAKEIESRFFKNDQGPEILVIIETEGSTSPSDFLKQDSMHASSVKKVLEQAPTSVVRPYIYPQEKQSLSSIMEDEEFFGNKLQKFKNFGEMKNSIENSTPNKEQTDVLMISPDETSEAAEVIESVTPLLNSVASGNFVVVHAPNTLSYECKNSVPIFHRKLGSKVQNVQRRLTEVSTRYIRITPDILAGLLFGFMFIFIVILGLTCLSSLQTPEYFAKVKPALGREF